jgi:hypothetical protein
MAARRKNATVPKQVVAIKTFECEANGKNVLVRVGDVFPSDDPVVKAKGRTKLFEAER